MLGESPEELYAATNAVLSRIPELELAVLNDLGIANRVERELAKRFDLSWRSYFLEVGRGNGDEYVQVFQP